MSGRGRAPSRALVLVAFAAVYMIWGSTYLAIRVAVETLPPLVFSGARFVVAGALLAVWGLAHGAARPTSANWKAAALVGFLLFPFGNGCLVWAETRLPSSIASLLAATEPLWVVLLLWIRTGVRPRMSLIAGVIAGCAGVGVLVGLGLTTGGTAAIDPIAALVVIGGALAWALGSLYASTAALPRAPILAAGMEMMVGGVILLVAGAASGEFHDFHAGAVSSRSVAAMLYLLVFGSLIGFSAYSLLVSAVAPARVATYAFVNPVIAVILGWAIGGETITLRDGVAGAVIVGAVTLIVAEQAFGARGREGAARVGGGAGETPVGQPPT